jgi:hypothetical protein
MICLRGTKVIEMKPIFATLAPTPFVYIKNKCGHNNLLNRAICAILEFDPIATKKVTP